MKEFKKSIHADLQHDFVFCDIIDRGEEVMKTYVCKCGAQKVEVFWLMKEIIAPKGGSNAA